MSRKHRDEDADAEYAAARRSRSARIDAAMVAESGAAEIPTLARIARAVNHSRQEADVFRRRVKQRTAGGYMGPLSHRRPARPLPALEPFRREVRRRVGDLPEERAAESAMAAADALGDIPIEVAAEGEPVRDAPMKELPVLPVIPEEVPDAEGFARRPRVGRTPRWYSWKLFVTNYSATTFAAHPTGINLNPIIGGEDQDQRVGRVICMKRLEFRSHISHTDALAAAATSDAV